MSFLKSVGNSLFGSGGDSGYLGIGQYKPSDSFDYDEDAFKNTDSSDKMRDQFASRLGDVDKRKAPTAAAATINQKPQEQFRGTQANLTKQLEAQAAGQGPSLAQSQLREATNRNIAQQAALAASSRGRTAGQGARAAQMGAATANQQAAKQAADLRMQEQMAARQQLAGVASDARSQDIGLATNQAGLTQQASLANQQAALQNQAQKDSMAQFYNQGMTGLDQYDQNKQMALEQLKGQQFQAAQDIKYNAYESASNRKAGFTSGLLNPASDENVKTNIQPANVGQGTSLQETLDAAGGGSKNMSSEKAPPAAPQASTATVAEPKKAVDSSVAAINPQQSSGGSISSGNAQKALGKSVGEAAKKYGPMIMSAVAAMSDENNKVNVQPLNRSSTSLNEGAVLQNTDSGESNKKGFTDMLKGLMGGEDGDVTSGGSGLMDMVSDKSKKEKIAPPDDKKLGRFVDSLKAYEYNYKDPNQPGAGEGKFVSPMAQDIEKTELGQGLVEDTPQGKIVNYGKAGGLLLATAAMLNDRQNSIEEQMAQIFKKKKAG